MEIGYKCKKHPSNDVTMICTKAECQNQGICLKCLGQHGGHLLVEVGEFWEGKILEMQDSPVELAFPNKLRILRENIQDNISHIEISNQMKKEIMSWGEQMKRETNTQIQSTVQGLLKQLEGGIGIIIYIYIYTYI